jgi:signal transduction histidine kinase
VVSWSQCEEGQPRFGGLVFGVFALSLGAAVAAQDHQFSHPNRFGWAIIVAVASFVLAQLGPFKALVGPARWASLVLFSLAVLGPITWVTVSLHNPTDFSPFFFVLLIALMAEDPGPVYGAVLALVCAGIMAGTSVADHQQGNLIWCFAFVISWIGGMAFRWQVQVAHTLDQTQAELASRAAEAERNRLAREVHDLVAHTLAVTMLHLTGARLSLQHGDGQEALVALEQAESAGRQAMAEIHRTVGLLGSPSIDAATPSALDLRALIAEFQGAGLEIESEVAGDLNAVPMGTGLASYRIIQESLANAVKHAPGAPVRVRVHVEDQQISLRVENPVLTGAKRAGSDGHGVRGMTERAELLGGTLGAGNGAGTWVVQATIPWCDVDA